jgi:hypothetical protein
MVRFLNVFQPKSYIHLCSPSLRVAYPAHLILLHCHLNEIWQGAEILNLLFMHFAPSPSYVLPLTSSYPTHYPLLQHSRSILFPSRDRPCFRESCFSWNSNHRGCNWMIKVTKQTNERTPTLCSMTWTTLVKKTLYKWQIGQRVIPHGKAILVVFLFICVFCLYCFIKFRDRSYISTRVVSNRIFALRSCRMPKHVASLRDEIIFAY